MDDGYIKYKAKLEKSKAFNWKYLEELNSYRQKLYNKHLIGAYSNKVGFGNISYRYQQPKTNEIGFLITGSATGNKKVLNENDFVFVKDVDLEKNTLYAKGPIKPSSESMTHASIYNQDDKIKAVIHVHNTRLWKKYVNIMPTTSKNATYGTPEIAKEITRLFKQENLKDQFIVLGGHYKGIIVYGNCLKQAYNILMRFYHSCHK